MLRTLACGKLPDSIEFRVQIRLTGSFELIGGLTIGGDSTYPRVQFSGSISDCRGKRWIAVDSTSAGGYLYALGHFAAHGIQKSDFSEISFAPGPGGKQEGVVLAVFAGKYDIGGNK